MLVGVPSTVQLAKGDATLVAVKTVKEAFGLFVKVNRKMPDPSIVEPVSVGAVPTTIWETGMVWPSKVICAVRLGAELAVNENSPHH